MVDYWKSNAKKYCDFCKCWIADNKPSVDFHEKGKRHKENVAIRLKKLSRQSIKDQKEKQKLDEDLKKMEEAAIQAYLKDVVRNADYSSQQLNEHLRKANSYTSDNETKGAKTDKQLNEKSESKTCTEWLEAISDKGYTYYWNTETGESVWEPPEEGYTSLNEQKKLEKEDKERTKNENILDVNIKRIQEAKQKEEKEFFLEEQRACLERQKMKERRVKEEKLETESKPVIGSVSRANPYGSWTIIRQKKLKQVDLQLPQLNRTEIKVPVINTNEPKMKFKEKRILVLENERSHDINFKKRKLNIGSKKNPRQRLDDD